MAEPLTYNLADLWEAVVEQVYEREALVCGDRRLTYQQIEQRANRLANHLLSVGIEPGDYVGCYLKNGTEYIETLIACFKIRAVPVNINYRYVKAELSYLLLDSGVSVLVCNDEFLPAVAEINADIPALRHTIHVHDVQRPVDADSALSPVESTVDGEVLAALSGPISYDTALDRASAERPPNTGRSNDDLYVLYTGGTTGLPKGVVWRMEDAFFGCIGGGDPLRMSGPVGSPEEMLDRVLDFDFCFYALAPLMHAAAQWVSYMWFLCGAKVVLRTGSVDPVEVWKTIEDEKVSVITVVGDAMARPLADAWDEHGPFDISSMYLVSNGGAPLTPTSRERLRAIAPAAMLTDGFGSSEAGIQGSYRLAPGDPGGDEMAFNSVAEGAIVLDADNQPVIPGSGTVGRVAQTGHIPLRYHNAPEKTAETFITIDGKRYVLPGDMARVEEDGTIVLLGRGSTSINTGGEKVFPEEVESVVKAYPGVYDAVVVGVPDERWGEAVAVIVQPVTGENLTLEDIDAFCRDKIAAYKIPRRLVLVDQVVRSPTGKADVRWARQVAQDSRAAV